MGIEKEVGYKILNEIYHNTEWFQSNWHYEDEDTKDLIVEKVGKRAFDLVEPIKRRKKLVDCFWAGVFIGALVASIVAITVTTTSGL